ncbi:MAG: bifunctional aspartate kinase/homoserine dehydrogenase I [Myxococcota bacterium]
MREITQAAPQEVEQETTQEAPQASTHPAEPPCIVHKFGGSSLANASRIQHVVEILLQRAEKQRVVVSAMQGVTDALIDLVQRAARQDPSWIQALDALQRRHLDTAQALLGPAAEPLERRLHAEFQSLHALLQAQALLGALSHDLLELISGLGEVWSAQLVHAVMTQRRETLWLDARDVLVVEKGELGATVDWPLSQQRYDKQLHDAPPCVIITGFVARTHTGRVTTLGRNGSDYSGAIFAALARAQALHIWTDVDGVLSADPRLVPEAVLIPELSYSEACELAYFGAKVIHPQTMTPAFERGIPIITRNTFNPSHPGTRITSDSPSSQQVKGVTTFTGLAILTIEGAGMIGVPGTARNAFDALKQAGISVIMISQGSSEHSICCVIKASEAPRAEQVMKEAFARELATQRIQRVHTVDAVAALAVVGDGMAGTPGVAARLFSALGRAGVNVLMIAQGASERNISVVVKAAQAQRALRAVHAGFYLSPQTLSVGILGPGHVGRALLQQLEQARTRLLEQAQVDLRVSALANRNQMLLSETGLTLEGLPERLKSEGQPLELSRLTACVKTDHLPHAVIVDCSASDEVAEHYAHWLSQGIHVVTPNKQAGAGPLERYQRIKSISGARFWYESTVGAGLPVITTLRDLLNTGDEVLAIDGILSGTLAWLFNRYDGQEPFSSLIRTARQLGYTEPDPRDDLSGRDVARKLVILARENGWPLQLSEVQLESLVPSAMQEVPLEQFMDGLEALDAPMLARLEAAQARGEVLRYVAQLGADGRATVGLKTLPKEHAFAHLRLTDNIIQFTTRRYAHNPLVVQGPGAGPEVTAAGVFADILRVAASVGAPL